MLLHIAHVRAPRLVVLGQQVRVEDPGLLAQLRVVRAVVGAPVIEQVPRQDRGAAGDETKAARKGRNASRGAVQGEGRDDELVQLSGSEA